MVAGVNLSRIMLFAAGMAGFYALPTAEASAQQVQFCAVENGICVLPYPAEVIYGNGKRTTSRFINQQSVRCSNNVFGDPAEGRSKTCSYVVRNDNWGGNRGGYGRDRNDGWRDPRGGYGRDDYNTRPNPNYGRHPDRYNDRGGQWRRCATEGGFCEFYGRKTVRYGTQNRFVERTFRNGVKCDNRTFGDPDRGSAKGCFVLD